MRTAVAAFIVMSCLMLAIFVGVQAVSSDDYFGRGEPGQLGTRATPPTVSAQGFNSAPRTSPLAPPTAAYAPNPFTAAGDQSGQLQSRYVDLARKHAALLDEDSLLAEIAATEDKIAELEAAQQVGSARDILQTVLKEYPDSEAARRARTMLGIRSAVTNPTTDPEVLMVDPDEILPTVEDVAPPLGAEAESAPELPLVPDLPGPADELPPPTADVSPSLEPAFDSNDR